MKENVEGRPVLLLGAGLVIGLTSLTHPFNFAFLFLIAFFIRGQASRITLALGLGFGLLLTPTPLTPVLERQFVSGNGTVVSAPRRGPTGTKFNLEMPDRTWEVQGEKIPDLSLGDEISVVGVGMPLREGSDQYLALHGVSGRLQAKKIEFLAAGPWPWRIASTWRRSFENLAQKNLPEEAAALTSALCFDLSGELPKETTDRLKETGTIHIVSASGLHVVVLGFAVIWALSKLPIPRGVQIAILAAILILYAGATGLNPPIVRAALMSIFGQSAYLFRREKDALSGLAVAAVFYLVWQPRQVYDPGFQLSFVTVGALAMYLHPIREESHLLKKSLIEAVRLSLVAFVASAPLVAYHFGTLSITALPSNLLVGGVASAVIVGAFAAQLVSFVWLAGGAFLLKAIAGPLAGWILWITESLGGHGWSSMGVPGFSAYWLPVVYGLLLMTWRQRIVQP